MLVFVLNKEGNPLMPCKSRKAKLLLKNGEAKVVKRYPFTIQLIYGSSGYKQPINLGIDSGYQNIGFSAITEKEELISGTVILDSKTKERLTERRMYRRTRRNKLRYRQAKFNNRTRKEGLLPPSIQRRYETHINLINRLKKVLPISNVIIEIASFDIQKILNPEINGVEYQQGNLYNYQNIRSYLMTREKGKCQLCGKEFSKTNPSHIHHIKPRNNGGTDRPDNLALLHEKCHVKLHKTGKYKDLKKNKEYKESTFMSIIHKRFWKDIPDLKVTFGYITFLKRNELGIEKTHCNDAFVIAYGTNQKRCNPIEIIQKHRNNRSLGMQRKGFAPSSRKQRYSIQPKDLVKIDGKWYSTNGCHCEGSRLLIEKKSISIKKVEKCFHFGSLIFNMEVKAFHPHN